MLLKLNQSKPTRVVWRPPMNVSHISNHDVSPAHKHGPHTRLPLVDATQGLGLAAQMRVGGEFERPVVAVCVDVYEGEIDSELIGRNLDVALREEGSASITMQILIC